MATFLLVHGACTGGWIWEKVGPLLEANGHKVCAPDMPGLGKDHTPPANVTLADNVEKVSRLLDLLLAEVEDGVAVGLLIAAGDQGVEAHGDAGEDAGDLVDLECAGRPDAVRGKAGRSATRRNIGALILRLARENPDWGTAGSTAS